MKQVVIENPVINTPFAEPTQHFKFDEEGITDEILNGRRPSAYFVPIARPRKKDKQLYIETEWTQDRVVPNAFVNRVRDAVAKWRAGGYISVTPVTKRLLEYWTNPQREKKLFFCQIEALETAIYITEVAKKHGDVWIDNDLRAANDESNPGLPRIAFKMATGTGKTINMAMMIAWQTLNKLANPQDSRFSDSFLIVTPGITIRDRLRVLYPNDPDNYYRKFDIVSSRDIEDILKARIVITNFQQMKQRERGDASKLTKDILTRGGESPFTETLDQMARRVCRDLGGKKNIIVINDEAHHCYRRKPDEYDAPKLKGEERKEAEKREEEARIWISGIEAIKEKIGVRAIYDLSATPFFLRGSGYGEGTLFPWVVSDFSLIDAIEAGLVKVPRVPVADDSMTGALPTYRDIWLRIREHLPKKGRGTKAVTGEPKLPKELEGALRTLYENYAKYYKQWEQNIEARANGQMPPVFIVVCNNTNVSKLVYDWVAGWEKQVKNKIVIAPGNLAIFSNEENGGWTSRPNTILVDSAQLESGEAMSADFKKIAAVEIEEFKNEYRQRFPGRDVDKLTDEDILREVMNTVGKPGKLGEHVKCVVSVSMLTEGWDANTVTHILGVRAFGTQLLCEQVIGRGLRRMSYTLNETGKDKGKFAAEYAEVYGVPFSFIPCSGSTVNPKPGPIPTHVRALEDRVEHMIRYPRVTGYKFELPTETIRAKFDKSSPFILSTQDVPTKVQVDPIVGEKTIHTLDDLKNRRENEIAFWLTKRVLDKYFRDDDGQEKPWLFPQLLSIVKGWMRKCVVCKDNAFTQMLILSEYSHDAADHVYKAIVSSNDGEKRLKPLLEPYDTEGSTRHVDFDTTRAVYATKAEKCHISHVVADTGSWEQKMAQTLEDMPEVRSYVKNHNIGFTIPYTIDGEQKNYYPDFIVRIDDGHGPEDLLNLIVEVTGQKKKDKEAKVTTASTLWVPAINNHGGFGRWAFIEIRDPWNAQNGIRNFLRKGGIVET